MSRIQWPESEEGRPTPHDLRRTGATLLASLGYDRTIQDKILNHVDNSVGGIYDRYDYAKEKQQALTALGEHLGSMLDCSDPVAIRQMTGGSNTPK